MTREECLKAAGDCVMRDRQNNYGTPEQNFGLIAALWTTLLNVPIKPHQIAQCMMAVKMARITTSPDHTDNWVDLAGYAACGCELATIQPPAKPAESAQEWELVEEGELIQEGDEYLDPRTTEWRKAENSIGSPVKGSNLSPVRRRKTGPQYRELGRYEVLKEGDEYRAAHWDEGHWEPIIPREQGQAVLTVELAGVQAANQKPFRYRRPIEKEAKQ